jgi:hypothetical protein
MASDMNIPASKAVWSELNRRKRPGDTFDDVLRDVLGLAEGDE